MLVYEYMFVCTQLYLRNGLSYCIKELCNLSLEIQGHFMGEGGILIPRHGRKVPQ